MLENDKQADDEKPPHSSDHLGRRSVLRVAGSAVVGGLGVTALASPAAAGMIVELDVKSNINLEGNGVIPAIVGAISPTKLPTGAVSPTNTPRFGPSRLFECQRETVPIFSQQQDDDLCALKQANENDIGATPVHGNGHRRGNQSAMLHFRTQEAGFVPEDVENGTVDVTLLYAVEDETGTEEAFVGTDVVKGVAPMN